MRIDEQHQFEMCFRVYAARVHTFALRRADPEVAQDVTAETFLIAWRRRESMPAEPLPWLYAIARRVLANQRRAADRRVALASRIAAQPALPSEDAEADREILKALAGLRESDREALLLCAWEGLSTREAANVLGCSPATFAVRLHRARGRLRRALAPPHSEPDRARPEQSVPEASP